MSEAQSSSMQGVAASPSPANRKTIVRQKSYALPLLWWLIAGTAAMGIILSLLPATGHDQLWFLWAGKRLLAGAQLYGPEIMEPNPPMIMWLSAAVTAIAQPLHLEPTLVFKALQLLALAATFALALRILQSQPVISTEAIAAPRDGAAEKSAFRQRSNKAPQTTPCRPDPEQHEGERPSFTTNQTGLIAPEVRLTLALFFITAYTVIPARDFGQREHLLSFLTLPYLLLAAVGSTKHRITAAILAGIGFCFKPQQVLVYLTVELLLLVRNRSLRSLRRPEPWIIAATLAIYVASIAAFTPRYFTTTIPLVRNLYWAVGHLNLIELLAASPQLQVLALLNLAGLILTRNKHCSFLACLLTAAGLAADAAYLQQGTGWYYQQIPGIVFLLAALFIQLTEFAQRKHFATPRWICVTGASLVTLAAVLTLHFSGYPVTRDRAFPIDQPDEALFKTLSANTPIAIISTNVEETMMPTAKYHLFWAQRMNNLWMLPAIFHSQAPGKNPHRLSPATIGQLDATQHQFMAEDIARWKPKLVLIERCYDPAFQCQMLEDLHPDLLAFFNQDPAFQTAFAPYAKGQSQGRFEVYILSTGAQLDHYSK